MVSFTSRYKCFWRHGTALYEWIFMWSIECQLFRSWLKKVLRNFKIKRTVRSCFEKAKTLRIQLPGELACEKWCWWFSYNFVNQIIWDNCHEFWDNWYEFTGWSILQIHVLLFALQWHKLTQNWCEFNALTQDLRSIPRFRHMHKNTKISKIRNAMLKKSDSSKNIDFPENYLQVVNHRSDYIFC